MATFVGTSAAETITPSEVSVSVSVVPAGAVPSDAADVVDGQGGADTIELGGGNDLARGSSGDDLISGGDGEDIALFHGFRSEYTIESTGGLTTVTDLDSSDGDDGTDTLVGIETLRFRDQDVAIDASTTPTLLAIVGGGAVEEGDAGARALEFTLTRLGPATGTTTVDLVVESDDADSSDFVGGIVPGGTVTFDAGDRVETVSVAIAGDDDFEPDETFAVVLTNPVGSELLQARAEAVIVNDIRSTAPRPLPPMRSPSSSTKTPRSARRSACSKPMTPTATSFPSPRHRSSAV